MSGVLDIDRLGVFQVFTGTGTGTGFLLSPTLLLTNSHVVAPYRTVAVELRDKRRGIILCTHNLVEAEMMADTIAIIRRGEIVAEGSPDGLKARLLGRPLMELRLAHAIDGPRPELQPRLAIESQGDTWLRYWSNEPTVENPALLYWLAERRIDVVTLSEVPRSLEEVYLRVVNQPAE